MAAHHNRRNHAQRHHCFQIIIHAGEQIRFVMPACTMRLPEQFRHGQERQKRQHRNGGNILKQQHRKACLPAGAAEQVFFAQGLQHNRGRGKRQYAARCHGHLPRLPQRHRRQRNHRHRGAHLQAAEPQKLVAQAPKHARRELEPDQKQHHHHAEFGHMLDFLRFTPHQPQRGADNHARQQIAEHRAQAQTFR